MKRYSDLLNRLMSIRYTFIICIMMLIHNVIDAQSSISCGFGVQYSLGTVCEGKRVEIVIRIDEEKDVDQAYNVYIDKRKINSTALTVDNDYLIVQEYVIASGDKHTLEVSVENNAKCSFSTVFQTINCYKYCPNQELVVKDYTDNVNIISVAGSVVSPRQLTTVLGDRVRLVAQENNVRYISTDKKNPWDTDWMKRGDTYHINLKEEGRFSFRSYTDSTATGEITTVCPSTTRQPIRLLFKNRYVYPEGFRVLIDGFDVLGKTYAYDASGHTQVQVDMRCDGKNHNLSIVDVKTNCAITQEYTALNCGGGYPCNVRLEAERTSRCYFDKVKYKVRGYTLSENLGMVKLYHNGRFLEELSLMDRKFEMDYDLEGNGGVDTITVHNSIDAKCNATLMVTTPNCSEDCKYIRLEVNGETERTSVIRIAKTNLSDDIVYNEVGQQIYFTFVTDDFLGLRYASEGPIKFDTGLQSVGFVYTPYLLPVGTHEFEVYNKDGKVLYTKKIYVAGHYEKPNLEMAYVLTDKGCSARGYDIYVDNVRYNQKALRYSLHGETRGTLILEGDDRMHELKFVDRQTPATSITKKVFLPRYKKSSCNGRLEVVAGDTCYNNDEHDITLTFQNKNTLGKGFHLYKDGVLLNPTRIAYDSTNAGQYQMRIAGNGRKSVFKAIDDYDKGCHETVTYTARECVTFCAFSNIQIREVDSVYYNAHPSTPPNYVGCVDSTVYYAVSFYEKYSDGTSYRVFLDNKPYATIKYEEGDGLNTFFIKVDGDGRDHLVHIQDIVDEGCSRIQGFKAKQCYPPCKIEIGDIKLVDCKLGVAQYELQLSDTSNQKNYRLYVDEKLKVHNRNGKTIKFNLAGDEKTHTVKVGATRQKDSLCYDTKTLTTAYCMPCDYGVSYKKYGDCDKDTMAVYELTFKTFTSDLVRIKTPREEIVHNIVKDGARIFFKLYSDGSEQTISVSSIEDKRCTKEFVIKTADCVPRVCTPSYVHENDGMDYVFKDKSSASDTIRNTMWRINGEEQADKTEITYTFAKAGTYEVCRSISTDYCADSMCKTIEVKDPCLATKVYFEYEIKYDSIQIVNTRADQYNFITYDFGDGTLKNSWNPYHRFDKEGVYKVCANVDYKKYQCKAEHCVDVVVRTSSAEDPLSVSVDIYPNPAKVKTVLVATGLSYDEIKDIRFVDASGVSHAAIYQSDGAGKVLIKNQSLPSGAYFLRMDTEKGIIVKKVLFTK